MFVNTLYSSYAILQLHWSSCTNSYTCRSAHVVRQPFYSQKHSNKNQYITSKWLKIAFYVNNEHLSGDVNSTLLKYGLCNQPLVSYFHQTLWIREVFVTIMPHLTIL